MWLPDTVDSRVKYLSIVADSHDVHAGKATRHASARFNTSSPLQCLRLTCTPTSTTQRSPCCLLFREKICEPDDTEFDGFVDRLALREEEILLI